MYPRVVLLPKRARPFYGRHPWVFAGAVAGVEGDQSQEERGRVGQRVDLELDMYGGKRTFEGRISGFTYGTGSTLSLLPA